MALLVVQFCLPFSGPVYSSELLNAAEAIHTGFVCAHTGADSGHESQEGHEHITHCHELDAPCVTTAGLILGHAPAVSTLTSLNNGTVLPGYGASIYIPPEKCV